LTLAGSPVWWRSVSRIIFPSPIRENGLRQGDVRPSWAAAVRMC
jgi:hypothetical protein